MSATPDPRDLTTAAIADLRASGPSTGEDWAQRLVDAGHGSLPEMTEFVELLDHPSVVLLADSRNAVLDTLLEGRVFTHRLSGGEIESGLLHADPDLAPVVMSVLGRADESVRVLFPDYDADGLAALGIADEHFPDGPRAAVRNRSAARIFVGRSDRGDGRRRRITRIVVGRR